MKVNCFISLVSSYHVYHLLIGAYCTVVVVVAVRRFTRRRNKVFMLGAIDRSAPSADSSCAIERSGGQIRVSIGGKVRING